MPARQMLVSLSVGVAVAFLFVTSLRAQQPPQLGYMYPPVVAAGKTTDVQLGGFDFTPDMQWFVHDDRIELSIQGQMGDFQHLPPPYWFGPRASTPARPIPREVPARLTVPADRPAGWIYWQVANANGSSKTCRFFVSQGEEILESRSRDLPQQISSLPVGISGRLSRLTEVDQYQWTPTRDTLVSVELMARRLGSDFLGVLEVHDSTGRLIADRADTLGNDIQLSFVAHGGTSYTIRVRDVDFRGDPAYVYRLEITTGPRVLAMLPTRGEWGKQSRVEFLGLGIMTGTHQLEAVPRHIQFPDRSQGDTFRSSVTFPFGTSTFQMPMGDLPEIHRPVPHDSAEMTLEAPVAVASYFPSNVPEQRYRWVTEVGETWRIDAQSAAVGGTLDLHLTLLDPEGKVVMENDDLPGTIDAGLEFQAAMAGAHTVILRDLTSRVGEVTEFYRLAIERRQPDFRLLVPQQISLPLGGEAEVTVQVQRYVETMLPDEIAVSVEGLPEGVQPVGEWRVPPGQNEVKFKLQSAEDAAVVARPITIRGTTTIQEQPVTRLAHTVADGNLASAPPGDRHIHQVMLAMTMTPPFDLLLIDRERQREVHRGTTYRAEFEIVRHPGFEGELELRMAAQQARYRQGIRGGTVIVAPEATRALYPCFMPEWLGTDLTRRMVVHGVARVLDPHGHERYLVKGADSRITMIMEGALLKVATPPGIIEATTGSAWEIPVQVIRSPKLPLPVEVRMEIPEELREFCSASPLHLPADLDVGTLRIQLESTPAVWGRWNLRLIATAWEDDQWEVTSEVEVPILVQAP